MSYWTTIRNFHTERFSVSLQWTPEDDPDVSWMAEDEREKLDSGEWINCTFRVVVLLDGNEVGADYLGNSVYADPKQFAKEHYGIAAKGRADSCTYCCYFPDMVRTAILDARQKLCDVPKLRCA